MSNNLLSSLLVVKRNEFKKFIPMVLLIFCILLNYSLIYSLKDSLIIPNLGAEAISVIELWVILPAVFVFTLGYMKLGILIADKEKIFHIICSLFLTFFIIFAFLLYPNTKSIELNQILVRELVEELPHLKWFIIIYSNWPLILFNIFSELWINIILLLFWQYANSITPSEQAKRFYPIFGFIGNLPLLVVV